MIPRYTRPEMASIWEPQTRFKIWFEIEAHACDAQATLSVIPRANAEAVWRAKDATFDVARIDEIEAVTKHDVIAFLTHLAEHIGADDFGEVRQEGDDVVVGFALDLVDARDVERRILGLGPDRLRCLLRNHAEFSLRVRGVRLDLEPDLEACLGLPNGSHFRAGVARDH